ncbi:hypothetical protein [uncultured Acidaminococcus sp.]|uniref:hypothetical protein n=1 Tax=uncultured Acidaminococcus sp. TaxID=352152 RepID=UPI002666BB5D|nr:hypothetical protein [uncultured Acidaminococcus sp.]
MTDSKDVMRHWDKIRENVGYLLVERGIPYAAASRMMGRSVNYLALFLASHIHKMPPETLERLLDVLGVPLSTLLREPKKLHWPLTPQELQRAIRRLEALRRMKHMNRGEFSVWLGYNSKTSWSTICRGYKKPGKAMWAKIESRTKIPLARLIEEVRNENPIHRR